MEGWSNLLSELNAKAQASKPASDHESDSEHSVVEENETATQHDIEESTPTKSAFKIPKIDIAQTKASLSSFRAKINSKVQNPQAVDKLKKKKSQKRQLRCAINRRVVSASEDAHEARLKATAAKGVVKFLDCVIQAQQA